MRKRLRKKIIMNFLNGKWTDTWYNPNTNEYIDIPCSGKKWHWFLRACNKKNYKQIAVYVLNIYKDLLSELTPNDEKNSQEFNNFINNSNKLISIYDKE